MATKYNSRRLRIEDGKVTGWIPTSKQPDYKTIFPATLPMFAKMLELIDDYNKPFWELSVKTRAVGKEENGSDILEYTVDVVEKRIEPTAEEKEAKRIEKVNRKIADKMPDMLRRGISLEEQIAEAHAIDEEVSNE